MQSNSILWSKSQLEERISWIQRELSSSDYCLRSILRGRTPQYGELLKGKQLLRQKVRNDLAEESIRIFLAEVDGEAVGYVQGEVIRRSDYSPRTVGQISLIYVIKRCRRKGIGTHLMKELWSFFDSRKAKQLTVRCIIGNREAEGFWRELGFTPIITTNSIHLSELNFKLKVRTMQEK
jgi:ribosomal protein S18 acetylase RimI-like enzyme